MTISDRRMRTRAALQSAATTVFARQGVAGASIEEICEEGGFTRGAFYSNYSSKDELVLDILDQVLAEVSAGANQLLADAGRSPREPCCEFTPEKKEAVLSDLLSHFRLPFSESRSAIIASREIRVHALRNPELQARMDEVQRVHEAQLKIVIEALLSAQGARLLISVEDLIMICSGCHDVAADEAVAADPEAEELTVDTSRLLMVLTAFVRFPGEEGSVGAGA